MKRPKLFVFASGGVEGGGSGFEQLVLASRNGILDADIVGVASNREHGGVRKHADALKIPFRHFPKPWDGETYQRIAAESGADFFALSGWLKLVTGLDPKTNFSARTVFNIHPGSLPEFGGHGYHGHRVHEAVIEAFKRGEVTHSAVTMHFLAPEEWFNKPEDGYDQGPVIFRCIVKIDDDDTADTLGKKVNKLEHIHQPRITNMVVQGLIKWDGVNPESLEVPPGYSIELQA